MPGVQGVPERLSTDGPLVISASQNSSFEDCNRKWWFEKVLRLPQVPKGYFIFGTVLHACLERWCSADEQGRVPSPVPAPLAGQAAGSPVEVFPPGWETVEERGSAQTVTPNEAALIRRLVEQAVERGLVARGDGRLLEHEFRLPVIEGVELVGFIDVTLPPVPTYQAAGVRVWTSMPEIHDHKTFSESGSRYLKQKSPTSPNYIGLDKQLLTYAAAQSRVANYSGPVVVRHNQFPKFDDGKGPRYVDAIVPAEAVAAQWEHIKTIAADMLRVRQIERWTDVPGPAAGEDTCSKYGGCPFRDICGRRSTVEGFRSRVQSEMDRANKARPNLPLDKRANRSKEKRTDVGDIFARPSAPTAVQPQASAPAEVQRSSATPGALINGGMPPAAPAVPAFPINAPPWADPNCSSCKGIGFNSKGKPCPICDAVAKKNKRPTSGMYLITGDAQAGFAAVARSEKTADLFALSAPGEWSSKGGSVAQIPTGVVAPVGVPAPAAPPVQSTPTDVSAPVASVETPTAAVPEASTVLSPETKTKGRKPIGLTILLGCVQMKGPRDQVLVQDLLERLGKELAVASGGTSYWDLDSFKRRDRLRQRAAEIAESLGNTYLVVPGAADPDAAALAAALIPYAQSVLEGVR